MISSSHQLSLPFLGLLEDESAHMTTWNNKVLESLSGKPQRRRKAAPSGASSPNSPNMRGVAGTFPTAEDVDGGAGPTKRHRKVISETRMLHMQEVRAKLERANESNRQAERNRHAIHDAVQRQARDLTLPSTQDLNKLDKGNYAHPQADKRLERTMEKQRAVEASYQSYLESSRIRAE